MTIKKRIIPKIAVVKDKKTAKLCASVTKNFANPNIIGRPSSLARIFEANLADEISILNIDTNHINIDEISILIKEINLDLSTPIMVGGGIGRLEDASKLFELGVEKVNFSFRSESRNLISQIVNRYGSQSINISLNYSDSSELCSTTRHCIPKEMVKSNFSEALELGAGEITLNNVDRDGSKSGLDLDLLWELNSSKPGIPIIVSGGAGIPEDFIEAFNRGASGVATGMFFSKSDQNPLQLRSRLKNAGIDIR